MTGPRNAAIASEIRAELGRREMSRRELARLISKPDTTVARWLRNETAMDADDIDAIAAALSMTGLELVTRAYNLTGPGPGLAASSGWRTRRRMFGRHGRHLSLIRPSNVQFESAA